MRQVSPRWSRLRPLAFGLLLAPAAARADEGVTQAPGWASRVVARAVAQAGRLVLRGAEDPSRLSSLSSLSSLSPLSSTSSLSSISPISPMSPTSLDDPGLDGAIDEPALDDAVEPAAPPPGQAEVEQVLPSLALLVAEPVRGVASSGFGWRDDPIRHRRRFHRGSDFRAPHGTPVHAAAAGEVMFAGRRHGYGRSIDVRHVDGLMTRYAHLSHIDVSRGDEVEADAVIGRVGASGRATGPHLHFEVRLLGRAVDPEVCVRVGELARTGIPGVAQLAALALRAEVQEQAVSALDPPRGRSRPLHESRREEARRKKQLRRRRPSVS